MIFLLDTNAFSDMMRSHPQVNARLAGVVATDRVITCPIVRGEIRYGIERLPQGKRRIEIENNAASLFAIIPCEPMPEAAGDCYARLRVQQQRKGVAMDENDFWIAATALSLGAVLVSRDGDFQQIAGLAVEDWTA